MFDSMPGVRAVEIEDIDSVSTFGAPRAKTEAIHSLQHSASPRVRVPALARRQYVRRAQLAASARMVEKDRRLRGFIFLRWLKRDKEVEVGLFASVDAPQELVVIKKLISLPRYHQAADRFRAMAPEIELCSLVDPLVQRLLPLDQTMTPFVQMHAFQVHDRSHWSEKYKSFNTTLFYKYYNGGTLYEFIFKHMQAERQVPEGFIWHVIAQIGRALSFLHTGNSPSPAYNVLHQRHIADPGSQLNKSHGIPGWKPICHSDGHVGNIWLHYPSDEEKRMDPQLEGFSDFLPQIILGDFGLAFQADNDDIDMLCRTQNPDLPEPETLRDKADLGSNIKQLMLADEPVAHRWNQHRERRVGRYGYHSPLLHPRLSRYSQELQDCLQRFEVLINLVESEQWYQLLPGTKKRDWENYPDNDFVYGTMIAMADKFVHQYIGSEDEQSVRWTQPANAYMPHRCPDQKREPGHFRADWKAVHENLQATIQCKFAAYAPGSVEVCLAEIAGGTPGRELGRVEYKGERPPPPPPPPPAATDNRPPSSHGPDSLPSYKSSEPEEDVVGARRATLVQPRETPRPGLPTVPEPSQPAPHQKRKTYENEVFVRRCREKGLM
ncbi:hypothetical protein VTK56DRAFT_10115 [Thermocarpiscus australiensis]